MKNCLSSYLDTKEIPDPDLLIRTSGEQRLSNYLLMAACYTVNFILHRCSVAGFFKRGIRKSRRSV